jgi:hypothetical protein
MQRLVAMRFCSGRFLRKGIFLDWEHVRLGGLYFADQALKIRELKGKQTKLFAGQLVDPFFEMLKQDPFVTFPLGRMFTLHGFTLFRQNPVRISDAFGRWNREI